jgi:hypothetical protein
MNKRLEEAFRKLSEELPEDRQELLADHLLRLLEIEDAEWDAALCNFADSKFPALVEEARRHYQAGSTKVLDLKKL